MTRYAMSIDMERCIGCQACVVACKVGNERPLGSNYIEIHESVRGQLPHLVGSFVHHRCFHCAEAACVAVCPTGTLSKWNGLTAVDMDKCSGCGYCTDACPYKIPTIVNGRVSKCVACLDLVQDGKVPWCVQTCPSQAIKFGEHDKLLAEATARAATLKTRYINAQVYGETQLGGLGLLMILLDKPEAFGLPASPSVPAQLSLWQSVVQPISIGVSALSVVVTGLAFVIARRQHLREKAALHQAAEPAEAAPAASVGISGSGDSRAAELLGTPEPSGTAQQPVMAGHPASPEGKCLAHHQSDANVETQPASSPAGALAAQLDKPTSDKVRAKVQAPETEMPSRRTPPPETKGTEDK